jgi:acyl-CoA synthetase (AMP-forming)/AMP-acid ligase II
VATLAWNGYRHMELYYAVSRLGRGAAHLNPRLHPDQVVYIADHAEDQVLFFDLTFLPLVEAVAAAHEDGAPLGGDDRPRAPAAEAAKIPNLLCYEDLIEAEDDRYTWPGFDENTASSLCYTSGTTGNPKGVLYSHRSTCCTPTPPRCPTALNCSARDCMLPVVPMFHVNAWGLPYVACMTGAKLVLPGLRAGRQVAVRAVREPKASPSRPACPRCGRACWHVESQRPEVQHHEAHGHRRLGLPAGHDPQPSRRLRRACAACLGHDRDEPARHRVRPSRAATRRADPGGALAVMAKQGRAVYGVDMKIVDDNGQELPWDGETSGDLLVRGPVDHRALLQGRGRQPLAGRLVPDRRRGQASTPTATCRSPTAART